MTEFISNLIGNDYLATLIMSILPLIELKGGIVFAWDSLGFINSFALASLGSTAVFFVIFPLLKPVINLLKKWKPFSRFAIKLEDFFSEKANKALEDRINKSKDGTSESSLKILAVFIFVAIPLPMTGVWTGTAIAVFLGLKFRESILPVCAGNFVAGLLVSLLSLVCSSLSISLDLVLWCLFILAFILFVFTLVKMFKPKKNKE